MEGDIQQQRSTLEDYGQAACSGWIARFERKMGFVADALFFYMIMRHKRKHPDYKSYGLDKYTLRYAKCALVELKIQVAYGGGHPGTARHIGGLWTSGL